MKILSISTSSSICSVCILEDKNVILEISDNTGNTHSVTLMPQIQELFNKTNLNLKDIDLLACDKGPGSFTGIRIGISTMKAFKDVTNADIIGVSSLLALAYNTNFNGYICSLIDAKNDNVYYGLFDNSFGKYTKIGEYELKNINYVAEILKNCNKPIFFVGNGSIVYKDVLKSILEKNIIFDDDISLHTLNSKSVGKAAFHIFSSKENIEDTSPSPLYLRKSNAERELEEKQIGN